MVQLYSTFASRIPTPQVAEELDETETQAPFREASREWARHAGSRSFRVEAISLVRQEPDLSWTDLAPILLGGVRIEYRRYHWLVIWPRLRTPAGQGVWMLRVMVPTTKGPRTRI
jgi:hypothetical protein